MSQNSFKNLLGLDISDYKIRFFQFREQRKNKATIRSFSEINVPPGYISAGEIHNAAEVVKLIKACIAKPRFGKADTKYVNASLPEKKTYLKTISIPNVPENEMRGAVSWGIEQNIPVTADQIYFDWSRLTRPGDKAKETVTTIVGVAPRTLVDSYTSAIQEAGLIPISLENESIALARCLVNPAAQATSLSLILDMGKSRTTLAICTNDAVYYTATVDLNGTEMTQAIADKLQLSFEDAEKAKIICGLDQRKGRGAIKSILEPMISQCISIIQDNINYYQTYLARGEKISTILLTGSVSQMVGLPEYIEHRLQCKTVIGDPWANLSLMLHKGEKNRADNFFSFTTAIGLALKKID